MMRVRVGAEDLVGAAGLIGQAAGEMAGDLEVDMAVGHGGLISALSRFGGRWRVEVEQLSSDAEEYSTRLSSSMRTYLDADRELARLAGKLTGQLESISAAGSSAVSASAW